MTSSIPADRQPAVRRALMSAFGTETCDSVVRLTGGLSGAGVFRIRVGGIAYLLRIEAADGGMFAPELWYPAMRIAAEAALAPRLVYADAADGVSICDYLEPRSLAQDYPGDREALLTELGQLLRHLHAAAPFLAHADYLGVLGILTDQFAAVAGPIPALATGREAIAAYATLEPSWCPATTTSIPGTCCSTGGAYGWWTGRPRSWRTATWTSHPWPTCSPATRRLKRAC